MGNNRNSKFETMSLVFGIISIITGCCCIGGLFGIAGIVFYVLSNKEIGKTSKSTAGLVTSIVGIILSLLILIIGIVSPDTYENITNSNTTDIVTEATTEADKITEETTEVVTEDVTEEVTTEAITEATTEADSATMGEKNALDKANSYLRISSFSYKGLIEQLEFEGFSTEESTYAADNCGADWNEQAAKKAQSYLYISSFSRQGLIEQLEFDGFTSEEAEYGVKSVGY